VWVAILGGVLAVAAIVVPLLVLAGSGQATLTAETYADVIRFGVQDAATLQIQIYDLSEKELWDSGTISGDFVDWDRTDTWGERLANGYYLYLAQAWDVDGGLVLSKTGKVALLPGDQVQLQAAPAFSPGASAPEEGRSISSPKSYSATNYYVSDKLAVGTDSPGYRFEVNLGTMNVGQYFKSTDPYVQMRMADDLGSGSFGVIAGDLFFDAGDDGREMTIKKSSGNVGIGTADAPAKLTVQAASGDLIAAYNSSSRTPGAAVFVVTNNGDVKADGSFYGASLIVGSADVAERINTSEWVEAGDVVEIDPDHAGFFRKSTDPYSRRVAGIISTSPGVILGNSTDSEIDDWDDNRPVLAITGRVPVKVTTENGPIQVGDLLVASSVPGVAMKGDAALSVGAVVGKAMEPLAEGDGEIMAQVMLR
jgi:hypothetical protein